MQNGTSVPAIQKLVPDLEQLPTELGGDNDESGGTSINFERYLS